MANSVMMKKCTKTVDITSERGTVVPCNYSIHQVIREQQRSFEVEEWLKWLLCRSLSSSLSIRNAHQRLWETSYRGMDLQSLEAWTMDFLAISMDEEHMQSVAIFTTLKTRSSKISKSRIHFLPTKHTCWPVLSYRTCVFLKNFRNDNRRNSE